MSLIGGGAWGSSDGPLIFGGDRLKFSSFWCQNITDSNVSEEKKNPTVTPIVDLVNINIIALDSNICIYLIDLLIDVIFMSMFMSRSHLCAQFTYKLVNGAVNRRQPASSGQCRYFSVMCYILVLSSFPRRCTVFPRAAFICSESSPMPKNVPKISKVTWQKTSKTE